MKKILIATMARNGVLDSTRFHNAFNPHFHDVTHGHALIVGERAWDTWTLGRGRISNRPLRKVYVVSKGRAAQTQYTPQYYVPDLESAFYAAEQERRKVAYVAGGATLFEEAIPRVDAFDLTFHKDAAPGNEFFLPLAERYAGELPTTKRFRSVEALEVPGGDTFQCTRAKRIAGGFIRTLWERAS